RQQRAPGVEEAHRVAHDLLHDAVELQRLREHVGELLEGEELGQPAVQLIRGAAPLPFALRHAALQGGGPQREPRGEQQRRGGDGEVHYANRTGPDTPGIVDLKRFVVYLAHAFNDQIAFRSELEDAKLEGAQPGGEVALEQAYLDYRLSDALTVRRITTFGLSYKRTPTT